MTNGNLVVGASKLGPQRRTGRPSDWTEAMAERFVEMLADTCNVTLAAKAINRSVANIYKHRAKDATFRAAWDQALATGYARLEMMMLERALHGVEKVVVARDGTTTVMREYSDRVALTLLRMHRDSAALAERDIDQNEDYRAACERIITRLERLKERETPDEGGGDPAAALRLAAPASPPLDAPETAAGATIEIKAARDVVALVRWALSRARG